MALFDTHCHLDIDLYDGDRDEVFARAHAAGVGCFLNPASDLASSARAVSLAEARHDTWAAVGIHPNAAGEVDAAALERLRGLALHPRVVAIGEIGLDYHWNSFPPDVARAAFEAQIHLAQEVGKPVIIHCRDAMAEVLAVLTSANAGPGAVPVLLHAFSGDADQARAAASRGYWFGLGGPLTFARADALRAIAAELPLESIVLETDSPYLTPHPFRGRRNEPMRIVEVARRLGELRGLDPSEIGRLTSKNATRLFNIPPTLEQE